jgi:hypothetical protein
LWSLMLRVADVDRSIQENVAQRATPAPWRNMNGNSKLTPSQLQMELNLQAPQPSFRSTSTSSPQAQVLVNSRKSIDMIDMRNTDILS